MGRTAIELEGINEGATPVLRTRTGRVMNEPLSDSAQGRAGRRRRSEYLLAIEINRRIRIWLRRFMRRFWGPGTRRLWRRRAFNWGELAGKN